ncbi:MAG: hypothetical protein QW259_08105 [Pyrobaculum sp.]
MEPRILYDITDPVDREELAHWVKKGVYNYAVAMPEEVPTAELEDLFKKAGYLHISIDAARWPKEATVATERGVYRFRKIEEGIYRLSID